MDFPKNNQTHVCPRSIVIHPLKKLHGVDIFQNFNLRHSKLVNNDYCASCSPTQPPSPAL